MAGQRKEVEQLEAALAESRKGVEEHTKKWKALKKSGGEVRRATLLNNAVRHYFDTALTLISHCFTLSGAEGRV
jgi:hypothetical protein